MSRLLVFLGVLAGAIAAGVVGLVFFSASPSETRVSPTPEMALAGTSFDLGEVPANRTVERTIDFLNSGVSPLTVSILKVRPAPDASCGCGVEGYEVRPETVQPNDRGQLVFKLRAPEGMPDMEDAMVAEVRTNDPARPDLTIFLKFRMAN